MADASRLAELRRKEEDLCARWDGFVCRADPLAMAKKAQRRERAANRGTAIAERESNLEKLRELREQLAARMQFVRARAAHQTGDA